MPRTIAVKVKYEMWVTYHVTINNKPEHEDEDKQFDVDQARAIEQVTQNCSVHASEQDGDWKMYTEVHWIVHKRAEHSASFMESESLHCMECTTDIPVEECLPEPPKKEEENAEV